MKISQTNVNDVLLIEPAVFKDERGFFSETWQYQRYREMGIAADFVQDNHSRSTRGTLRGLHYQMEHTQGKLVRTARGSVYDVVVDMRQSSSTFGQWYGVELNDENQLQLWVPPGFAHGFYVLSDVADFQYKCTDYYSPESERCLLWNDSSIGIDWPMHESQDPIISEKDQKGTPFNQAEYFA